MTIIDELKTDLLESIKGTELTKTVTDTALNDRIASLNTDDDQPVMFLVILKAVIRDILTLDKPETELWTAWMSCLTRSDLMCLGACIKLVAGYSVDDKELYLSRLRKLYSLQMSKAANTYSIRS